MKIILKVAISLRLSFFIVFSQSAYSQTAAILKELDTAGITFIKIHFLHGSKPAKCCKKTEGKWFGGIHGGHVYMQAGNEMFSFLPLGNWHIFAHKKDIGGGFFTETEEQWRSDTAADRYTTIEIPLSKQQTAEYAEIRKQYLKSSPYDYAFFGMWCASAAYEVLSHLDIVKPRSNFSNVRKNFYPKKLRKKLLRLARKNNWTVIRKQGRVSRKWERE